MNQLFLGINTAIEPYGFCLANQNNPLTELTSQHPRKFTETFIETLNQTCQQHQQTLHNITAIGVIKGPGSYTGLRLGVSYAKSLALSLNCPVYGFSSLEIIAKQLPILDKVIAVAISSKKNECYLQLFNHINNTTHSVSHPINLNFNQFKTLLTTFKSPLTIVGTIPTEFSDYCTTQPHISFTNQIISSKTITTLTKQNIDLTISSDFAKLKPYYFHQPKIGKTKKMF